MKLNAERIRGVIFDVDGTLLDTMPIWEDMSGDYLQSQGIEPRPDLNEKILNMTIDEGVHYVKVTYQVPKSESVIKQELLDRIRHFYYEEASFKPGARQLIEQLHRLGIPMVIATSGDQDLAGHALMRLGVRDFFQKLYTSNDLNTNKEQPYIFYKAAKQLLGLESPDEPAQEKKTICLCEPVQEKEEEYAGKPAQEVGLESPDEPAQNKGTKFPCGLTQEEVAYFTEHKMQLAEIYVVEDSLIAVKTAKAAGFSTIAVEDASAEANFDQLRRYSDYFLASLREVEIISQSEMTPSS